MTEQEEIFCATTQTGGKTASLLVRALGSGAQAWRRDLGYQNAPRRIDWIWARRGDDADPGLTASAGTQAILAQLKVRPDDPDFEAKAHVVYMTTAMREGFHVISGSHAHG